MKPNSFGISVVSALKVNALLSVSHNQSLSHFIIVLPHLSEKGDVVQCHPVYPGYTEDFTVVINI